MPTPPAGICNLAVEQWLTKGQIAVHPKRQMQFPFIRCSDAEAAKRELQEETERMEREAAQDVEDAVNIALVGRPDPEKFEDVRA